MFKAVIVVISFLMLVALIETRPRHRHRHRSWHKYLSYSEESSEGDGIKSCTNCNYVNIGNGYKNHNIIYYGSKSKPKTENTESERKPHHRHRYDSDESEEDKPNTNSCTNCQITNIGNGEHNYNIIYYR